MHLKNTPRGVSMENESIFVPGNNPLFREGLILNSPPPPDYGTSHWKMVLPFMSLTVMCSIFLTVMIVPPVPV